MTAVSRIVGIYLIVAALAALCLEVIEPLVWDIKTRGYSPVWLALDPMSAAGILLGAVFAYRHKRAMDKLPDDRAMAKLAGNVLFYGFIAVGPLFFRSWFSDLTGHAASDVSLDTVWGIAYAGYIPLAIATGVTLLRGGSRT